MQHEIKDTADNPVTNPRIKDEICFALEHDMTHTFFHETRIDIVEHHVDTESGKILTIVEVDYD